MIITFSLPLLLSYSITRIFAIMPSAVSRPLTLYDKVVRDHVVDEKEDGTLLIYIGSLLPGYIHTIDIERVADN